MGLKRCFDYLSNQARGNREAKRLIRKQLLFRRNKALLLHGLIGAYYLFQLVQSLAFTFSQEYSDPNL